MADRRTDDKTKGQQADERQLPPRLRRRLYAAHLTLWWEHAWRRAWPLPSLLATFFALALFDVLPLAPGWLHAGLLLAFGLAVLIVCWRVFRLPWPSVSEAGRRLEQDSGLAHRPLQTLTDRLSAGAGDPVAQTLWQAEQRRLQAVLQQLSLKRPAPDLARHDPWGLRFAPLLLLAIALSGGTHDVTERLLRAVRPNLAHLGGPGPMLQVWLTPPDYTGKAPILLDDRSTNQPLVLPADTKLLAVLQGGHGKAQLFFAGKSHPFQTLDGGSQRLESTIDSQGRLQIRQGRRQIGTWRITLQDISPPSIGFASPPESDPEGRLRLDIEGRDTYGIAKAWANIRRVDRPDATPMSITLPLGGGHPATVRQAAWHDLTNHPWAGLPVTIEPEAENVAGQRATGEPANVSLPERTFTNPVARAIVAQRGHLAVTPDQRLDVADALAGIAAQPESFGQDVTVFLALSTASSRLRHDQSPDAIPSVIDLLWQTALRIEEGDRPEAQRALDETARALEQALADGASQAEIERLMTELQTAMARYLDALAEQAERQGEPLLPADPDQPTVSPEELEGMLEHMRALSRTGSSEAARQMLSELRQMLDGLGSAPSGEMSGQASKMRQGLRDLQTITEQQRQLLDDVFKRAQKTPDPTGSEQKRRQDGRNHRSDAGKMDVERQEGLRERLRQTLQRMDDMGADVPDALGQAEQAMQDSTQALKQDALQDAIDAQTEAVARLQDGSRAAAQSWAKQSGGGTVRPGSGRDPLGRSLRNGRDENDHTVKIPDQAEVKKAREVLDELRRRAGQAERPSAERDYLQRLLKHFF
ncbi:MAG TPA: TIGR02302 family protein [Telmatospirillum sp.]|nr:TIGR02302 family protein [Telmatospirillum sp.]